MKAQRNGVQFVVSLIAVLAVLFTTVCLNVTAVAEDTAAYVKVTEAPADWSGDYLIVYEAGEVAFNGGLATLDGANNNISVTITDGKIAADATTNAAKFTIAKSGDNYTIKSASGYYIGNTGTGNALSTSTGTQYTSTITLNDDGSAHIVASGGTVLRYNASSGNYRFRYFKSSTYTNQKVIALYKYVEPTTGGEGGEGEGEGEESTTTTTTVPSVPEEEESTTTTTTTTTPSTAPTTPVTPDPNSAVTITFDDTAKRTEFSTTKQVWTENGITVTNLKTSTSSNIADNSNPIRFYKNSELIVAYPNMAKIDVACNSADYASDLASSITDATVTTNDKVVSIVLAAATDSFSMILSVGQVRVDSITVYTAAEEEPSIPTDSIKNEIPEELASVTFPQLDMLGASVRGDSDIRFGVEVSIKDWGADLDAVTDVRYGTLFMPTELLGDSELTFATADMLDVPTTKWQENLPGYEGRALYTSVLLGLPTTDTAVTARGYMLYQVGGEWYVQYSAQISRTINGVYAAAAN